MCNRILILFISLVGSSLASCKQQTSESANSDFNYTSSFEELGRWSNSDAISREMSHTGQFSTFTDSGKIYSQTFFIERGDLKNNHAQTLHAEAWVLSNQPGAASSLVISVEHDDKIVDRSEADAAKILTTGMHWEKITCDLKLAEPVEQGYKIKVYGWYRGGARVYWDDFCIRIY